MSRKTSIISALVYFVAIVFLLGASAAIYSFWRFQHFESELERLNVRYVPAYKAVSELKSHFTLFEGDVDGDGAENFLSNAKNSFNLQMIKSKVELLERVYGSGERQSALLHETFNSLKLTFDAFRSAVFQEDLNEVLKQKQLFRKNLNQVTRDLDREIRKSSIELQAEIRRDTVLIAGAVFASLFIGFFGIFWFRRLLTPLRRLTDVVREISSKGILGSREIVLTHNYKVENEVSTLTREFNQMASSLRDQAMQLERQNTNIHKAHLDLKKQNDNLKKTRAKLLHSEKLALVGKMSAQLAHEIRNPLNAISLRLELLEQDLTGKDLESIKLLQVEIERLTEVSQGYLDIARKPELKFKRTNLVGTIEESLKMYGPLFAQENIKLYTDFDEQLPEVEIDEKQVKQVVSNLIRNSIEAMRGHEGENNLLVYLKKNDSTGSVDFIVEDTGCGILDTESLFTPFFSTKSNGTGLGLAHSKQIIEAHGGEIKCYSDKSTVFQISFPVGGAYHA